MALQSTVKKAPAPAIDFVNSCKADPVCRNPAVWFNKDLKLQHCESHSSDSNGHTMYPTEKNLQMLQTMKVHTCSLYVHISIRYTDTLFFSVHLPNFQIYMSKEKLYTPV